MASLVKLVHEFSVHANFRQSRHLTNSRKCGIFGSVEGRKYLTGSRVPERT